LCDACCHRQPGIVHDAVIKFSVWQLWNVWHLLSWLTAGLHYWWGLPARMAPTSSGPLASHAGRLTTSQPAATWDSLEEQISRERHAHSWSVHLVLDRCHQTDLGKPIGSLQSLYNATLPHTLAMPLSLHCPCYVYSCARWCCLLCCCLLNTRTQPGQAHLRMQPGQTDLSLVKVGKQ
jgi:hypothetical protein